MVQVYLIRVITQNPLRNLLACGIPSSLGIQHHRWIVRYPSPPQSQDVSCIGGGSRRR
jgi:hypothetical protein